MDQELALALEQLVRDAQEVSLVTILQHESVANSTCTYDYIGSISVTK